MKIIVKIISIFLLILFVQFIFADEHMRGNDSLYHYYNSNGSLDWDTFYARWDEMPDSYYIYLFSTKYNRNYDPTLYKFVDYSLNRIVFGYQGRRSKLEIIFSPNSNYASLNAIIRIGRKSNNYGEAIKQWNLMLENVE